MEARTLNKAVQVPKPLKVDPHKRGVPPKPARRPKLFRTDEGDVNMHNGEDGSLEFQYGVWARDDAHDRMCEASTTWLIR